jgi:hypothetical protein
MDMEHRRGGNDLDMLRGGVPRAEDALFLMMSQWRSDRAGFLMWGREVVELWAQGLLPGQQVPVKAVEDAGGFLAEAVSGLLIAEGEYAANAGQG